jgi:hypothetical protein
VATALRRLHADLDDRLNACFRLLGVSAVNTVQMVTIQLEAYTVVSISCSASGSAVVLAGGLIDSNYGG